MLQSGKETILVIDDDRIVLSMTEAMLVRSGYGVITSLSGKQAVELLENCAELEITLALIDVVMKDMPGQETAKEIERLRPGLPIIFMTGFPEHGEFLAARGQVVLHKPFTSLSLIRALRKGLRRPRPSDSSRAAGAP
jgi:hypothetical protein